MTVKHSHITVTINDSKMFAQCDFMQGARGQGQGGRGKGEGGHINAQIISAWSTSSSLPMPALNDKLVESVIHRTEHTNCVGGEMECIVAVLSHT